VTDTRLAPAPSRSDTLPQARRVRRVIRKIDVWSVLKFSLVFFVSVFVVLVVAGIVLFIVASVTGVRHDIEKSIGSYLASTDFHILGGEMLRATILGGVVLVATGTAASGLMALFYNLISDVVGGVEVIVLEEDPAAQDV
jgi:transmembrane protein DUF3566